MPICLHLFLICVVSASLFARPQEPGAAYVNDRVVTNPVVNAKTFINNNTVFALTDQVPWDAQNVTNWLNEAVMSGSLGFRFDQVLVNGDRQRSTSFRNNGIISAIDGGGFSFIGTGDAGGSIRFQPNSSFVQIYANSITNRGELSVGSSGLIKLSGNNVDLAGSSLLVEPLGQLFFDSEFTFLDFFLISETNFVPDPGLYDQAWSIGSNTNVDLTTIVLNNQPLETITPPFNITNALTWCVDTILIQSNATSYIYQDFPTPTNAVVQIITVAAPTNLFNIEARFLNTAYPGTTRGNRNLLSPAVRLSTEMRDLVNDSTYTLGLYVIDQIASSTNAVLLENLSQADGFRPSPIIVSRGQPFAWLNGQDPTSTNRLTGDLFYSPVYSNQIITNLYASYVVSVENSSARLPNLRGVGISNAPGRLEITADRLNLRNTRMRSEGLASIQATSFQGSDNLVLDAKYISAQLTSATALAFDNIAPTNVDRVGGPLRAYSMTWTNTAAAGDGTNTLEIIFSWLAVDAADLHKTENVYALDLALTSPVEVTLSDPITISNRFRINSPRVTIDGPVRLEGGANWDPSTATNVTDFMISSNGSVSVYGLASFEGPLGAPLDSMVNNGTILASAHVINSDYFENAGDIISTNIETRVSRFGFFSNGFFDFCDNLPVTFTNTSPSLGIIRLNAAEARLDGGTMSSGGQVNLNGGTYKLRNMTIDAGALRLNVNDTLTDAGAGSDNTITVTSGFEMDISRGLPAGDLLGTTIESLAAFSRLIEHRWGAVDLGASLAGYTNGNLAIGVMSLRGATNSEFSFLPSGSGQRAFYIDRLEVDGWQAKNIRNFTNWIYIDPSVTVYFADLVATNPLITAELVNRIGFTGRNEGRMVWVPGFNGPNSSVDILRTNGRTEQMNRALRESIEIDSDRDGIANGFDPFPLDSGNVLVQTTLADGRVIMVEQSLVQSTSIDSDGDGLVNANDPRPFDPVRILSATKVVSGIQVRFKSAANTNYRIEVKDGIGGSWQLLKSVRSDASGSTTVTDSTEGTQRFYRVTYVPGV